MGRNRAHKRGSRARCAAVEHPTHRQMALQCPQGSSAHRQTHRGMRAAAMADTSTLPCHGEGKLPRRPAANQSRVTEPARYDAPCNRKDPCSHRMAVGGQEGSWGIHRYTLAHVQPPRSIATPQRPSLGSAKFGENGPKSGTQERVEGVLDSCGAPHTPTNGLAVSPGFIRSQANPSRHACCCHGRHIHLTVPWGRQTSQAAGRQSISGH